MNEINQKEIRSLAKKISEDHTFNKNHLCWRLAETELILETGTEPSYEIVTQLAKSIAEQNIEVEKLHWYLAEKIILVKLKWNMDLIP